MTTFEQNSRQNGKLLPSVADPLIDCVTTVFAINHAYAPEPIGSLHDRGSGTEVSNCQLRIAPKVKIENSYYFPLLPLGVTYENCVNT